MIGTLFLCLILDRWTWPQLCSATDFLLHVSRYGSQFESGACFFDDGILHLLMLSGSPADSLFSFAISLLNHWRFFSLPNMERLKHLMPLLSNALRWQKSRSCSTSFLVVDKFAWPFCFTLSLEPLAQVSCGFCPLVAPPPFSLPDFLDRCSPYDSST